MRSNSDSLAQASRARSRGRARDAPDRADADIQRIGRLRHNRTLTRPGYTDQPSNNTQLRTAANSCAPKPRLRALHQAKQNLQCLIRQSRQLRGKLLLDLQRLQQRRFLRQVGVHQ